MHPDMVYLKEVSEQFCSGTFFTPKIGAEVEFYLTGDVPKTIMEHLSDLCQPYGGEAKKEKGQGQYEISLPAGEPVQLARQIIHVREAVAALAQTLGLHSDFSAKPLPADYGNALHIHINLLAADGRNVFAKNSEEETSEMHWSIGGLLATMGRYMPVFAPYPACYERLRGGMDAPATLSWGGNNRTVALRLPATTTEPQHRRIEHRVPAADANPYRVIGAILEGVQYGLTNHTQPSSPKIYGNAGLAMYGLPLLAPEPAENIR